jgi:hypothetical protein
MKAGLITIRVISQRRKVAGVILNGEFAEPTFTAVASALPPDAIFREIPRSPGAKLPPDQACRFALGHRQKIRECYT